MEKESLFMREMKKRGKNFLAPDDLLGYSNSETINLLRALVKNLIRATSEFDFQCNFDDEGNCKAIRKRCNRRSKNDFHAKMCCCSSCYGAMGYLTSALPITKQDLSTYEKAFRRGIGFWRRGKGCSLPRELRSAVCVFYACGSAVEKRVSLESMRMNCINAIYRLRTLTAEDAEKIEAAKQRKKKTIK